VAWWCEGKQILEVLFKENLSFRTAVIEKNRVEESLVILKVAIYCCSISQPEEAIS